MKRQRRDTSTPIFHLALPDDWAAATMTGTYTASTRGRSLDEEGFIHCSTIEQVEPTANRFYADLDQVVVLAVDQSALDADVKWEPPTPTSAELFPHIYGPIPLDAIARATVWHRTTASWQLTTLDP